MPTNLFFSTLRAIKEQGFLVVPQSDINNGIGLCDTCHTNFDLNPDPGLIIVPTDLEFFVEFEKANYDYRVQQARLGIASPRRKCPSANDYQRHQATTGDIPSDGLGLYSGIILTDFLGTVERPVLDPRPWHGEPVHMIRRAFSGLSSLNYRNIPDNPS